MIPGRQIVGGKVRLRALTLDDCTAAYLSWMKDEETNRYMETRWGEQTIDSIKSFVSGVNDSKHSYIFAIEYCGAHVGNIKIGPINTRYRNADISYFIGEKAHWGKGLACDAVACAVDFAFRDLSLNRLQAGCFRENVGSQKVLENNDFRQEATFRQKYFLTHDDGEKGVADWTDCYEYALLACEWRKKHSILA